MSRGGHFGRKTTVAIVPSLSGYSTRVVRETDRQFAQFVPGFQREVSLLEVVLYLLAVSQHQKSIESVLLVDGLSREFLFLHFPLAVVWSGAYRFRSDICVSLLFLLL